MWRLDLDETNLDENVGIQDTAHPTDLTYFRHGSFILAPAFGPVDWNQDGNTTDTGLQLDLNSDGLKNTLYGADDWAWIHARLTPPSITSLLSTSARVGDVVEITGVNLMAPGTVEFKGHASAPADFPTFAGGNSFSPGPPDVTDVVLSVTVPPGAKSGRITIVTPEGKATSGQNLTIIP